MANQTVPAHHIEKLSLSADGLLQLQGWALETVAIHVYVDGGSLFSLACDQERNDVLDHFNLPQEAACPGFAGMQSIRRDFFSAVSVSIFGERKKGDRYSILKTQLVPSENIHSWRGLYDENPLHENNAFYFPIATSRVASGGAEGIRETFSPFESPTMKVGIRTQILYLRTTLGREGDFAFDPDFVPNKKCDHNERLVAEDSLHAVMDHAIRTQTPVLFTLNGGIWADSAGQSLEWDINDVLEQDESLCQWNQFNQVMPDTALSNLPGSVDSPELGRSISLNVYMEKPRFYKKRNLQAACRIINAFREKHPSLFIGVNLDADVYMNPFFPKLENPQWYDYNPQTLRQFRHWLRGDGPYAGNAEDGVPDLSSYRRKKCLTLARISKLAKKKFATWDDVQPPRQFLWHVFLSRTTPRWLREYVHFTKNPWIALWAQFRRHLVQLHYDELSQWVAETGIPSDRIYSSQGFMEPTIRLDPLAERIDSPVKNYDTGGASIEGACPKHGHLGVIIYGQCATNNIITESKTSLFNEFRRNSAEWAVVEHNTGDLTRADFLGSYADAYRSLRDIIHYGSRFVSSMAWNGSPGEQHGQPGFLGYTSLRRSPLEAAMIDIMQARAGLPRQARLWTFGAGEHVDSDGWLVNGEAARPVRASCLLLGTHSPHESITLDSPPELAWPLSTGSRILLKVHQPSAAQAVRVKVSARSENGLWREISPFTPFSALPQTASCLTLEMPACSWSAYQLRLTLVNLPAAGLALNVVALLPGQA